MKIFNNLFLYIFLSLLFCTSCTGPSPCDTSDQYKIWRQNDGKLKILTTTAMIEDVVSKVGGEYISSLSLITGELNPHAYQLVKGDDEKLLFADLIFFNGLGMEHGPSLQHHLFGNPKAIALGDKILDSNKDLILSVDGQYDPHLWMDISLWARIIEPIVETLSDHDPLHKNFYVTQGKQLKEEMLKKHYEVWELLQQIPENKRYLVTSHDAFNYFTRAYLAAPNEKTFEQWSVRFAAPEGLAPESQLSAVDIKKIIDHLDRYHIEVIFPESNVSRDSIKKIVSAGQERGLKVVIAKESLYGDAMGCKGSSGETYLKMIDHNAKTIYSHLGK